MKKLFIATTLLVQLFSYAQEHFAGLSTSSRVGIIAADINPAELNNMSHKFEINGFGTSINVANNKVSIKDVRTGSNFEKQLFTGTEPVNARVDAVILGPGIAIKIRKSVGQVARIGNI